MRHGSAASPDHCPLPSLSLGSQRAFPHSLIGFAPASCFAQPDAYGLVLAVRLGSATPPMAPRAGLTAAERALHDQSNLLPRRQLVGCLGVMSLAMLTSFIDQNGISTVLPTIADDLDARDTISWAGTASLLANATFQMLYGRLSDIFGRKAVFVAAVLLLAVADLLCGLSTRPAAFYVFRALAGVGGGGISNLCMIIVSDVVSLERRGKYQGINGSMIGLGSVAGPFLAAAFVDRATWSALFYMLAPLGALNGLLAFLYLPSNQPTAAFLKSVKNIDAMGTLTSSTAIIFLLVPISVGVSPGQRKGATVRR